MEEVLDIDVLLKSPNIFLNKKVLIDGEITEVCPWAGCWINVKHTYSDSIIFIKVPDGEIVFPLSAVGNQIKVEGKFIKMEFPEETVRKWKIQSAQVEGEILHPDSVIINEDELYEYRINAKSAIIY